LRSLCDSCVLESTRVTGDMYFDTDSNNNASRGSDPATGSIGTVISVAFGRLAILVHLYVNLILLATICLAK
jgi:hypothetical protein